MYDHHVMGLTHGTGLFRIFRIFFAIIKCSILAFHGQEIKTKRSNKDRWMRRENMKGMIAKEHCISINCHYHPV